MDEVIIVGAAPSAEQLERMLDDSSLLSELPDLEMLLQRAIERRTYFGQIELAARVEIEKANDYITRLSGQPAATDTKKRKQSPKRCSPETYRAVLTKLAEHKYAGLATLTGAGVSTTTAGMAAKSAVEAGHATVERRGKKNRFAITDAGMEFLTGP